MVQASLASNLKVKSNKTAIIDILKPLNYMNLTQNNFIEMREAIQKALKLLKKNNLGLIIHGPSFPSLPDNDTGFGSPYSLAAKEFMEFISYFGFNCIQLGPSGKTGNSDPSPYTSTIYSGNPLFIDLYQLTTEEMFCLLSKSSYSRIITENPLNNTGKIPYRYVYKTYQEALKECWANFKHLTKKDSERFKVFLNEFNQYKDSEATWLNNDAIYEALTIKNQCSYWPLWENDVDKNLIKWLDSNDENLKQTAQNRFEEIHSDLTLLDEIEYYKFCQFILFKQINNFKNSKNTLKTIADIQVTYSDRDWWANQDAFLDDFWLGVPPDFFSKNGQSWGFPVINPDKIFEKDQDGNIVYENQKMKLAKAGKLIKDRFSKMFKENPGGIRIDHIIGLIDPWVYPKTSSTAKCEDGGARLYSSPEKGGDFLRWAKVSENDINHYVSPDSEYRVRQEAMDESKIALYSEVIDIIIDAAIENNLDFNNIICEDLGTLTEPVKAVLEKKSLSGIRVTEFVNPIEKNNIYRGKNVEAKHWVVPGTHDNDTLYSWAKGLVHTTSLEHRVEKNSEKHETKNLEMESSNIHCRRLALDLRKQDGIEGIKEALKTYKNINNNPKKIVEAKILELFLSPSENIQIMFTDFFGILQRYNIPGAEAEEDKQNCWRLRVPNNYQKALNENLSMNFGVNMPMILAYALEINFSSPSKEVKDIISTLEKYSKMLNNNF